MLQPVVSDFGAATILETQAAYDAFDTFNQQLCCKCTNNETYVPSHYRDDRVYTVTLTYNSPFHSHPYIQQSILRYTSVAEHVWNPDVYW